MIFSSDPVIKYSLLISMAVLIVSLVKQVFFYREEQWIKNKLLKVINEMKIVFEGEFYNSSFFVVG